MNVSTFNSIMNGDMDVFDTVDLDKIVADIEMDEEIFNWEEVDHED